MDEFNRLLDGLGWLGLEVSSDGQVLSKREVDFTKVLGKYERGQGVTDGAGLQRVDALWMCRKNVRKRKRGVRGYKVRYKYWNRMEAMY